MNEEMEAVAEYNTRIEKKRWSRFVAAMVFSSAILYLILMTSSMRVV